MKCDCDSEGGEEQYRKEGEHSMQLLCHSLAFCKLGFKTGNPITAALQARCGIAARSASNPQLFTGCLW
jgi:hypothetical protein